MLLNCMLTTYAPPADSRRQQGRPRRVKHNPVALRLIQRTTKFVEADIFGPVLCTVQTVELQKLHPTKGWRRDSGTQERFESFMELTPDSPPYRSGTVTDSRTKRLPNPKTVVCFFGDGKTGPGAIGTQPAEKFLHSKARWALRFKRSAEQQAAREAREVEERRKRSAELMAIIEAPEKPKRVRKSKVAASIAGGIVEVPAKPKRSHKKKIVEAVA